jgi:hypothetical protein
MKLNLDRLEKVRQRGSKTHARCPACAEMERDKTGDNLVIFDSGSFACAAHQQDREHARRILQLAGKEERRPAESRSAFPPPMRHHKPVQSVLPPDFAAITLAARRRVSRCQETQARIAAEFGVQPETIRRLSLVEGGAIGFFPSIRIGGTPCLPDRIGYLYPQGIKIRHPWGPDAGVRFAWACGSATEPWRYSQVSARPGVQHYFITEGESDLIALVDALIDRIKPEHGIGIVASPGTSFKEEWAALFKGCSATLVFDDDPAGAAATRRALILLRKHATLVRILIRSLS